VKSARIRPVGSEQERPNVGLDEGIDVGRDQNPGASRRASAPLTRSFAPKTDQSTPGTILPAEPQFILHLEHTTHRRTPL